MTDGTRSRSTARGETGAITVEDVYDASPEELWDAITSPERLARWIAEVDGDPRLGGRVSARFTSSWTGEGTIEVCDPPRRLVVAWHDGDIPTTMTAELTPEGSRTRLVVVDDGIPTPVLPDHAAGWDVHLADLGLHLRGEPRQDWHERWVALRPSYDDAEA